MPVNVTDSYYAWCDDCSWAAFDFDEEHKAFDALDKHWLENHVEDTA